MHHFTERRIAAGLYCQKGIFDFRFDNWSRYLSICKAAALTGHMPIIPTHQFSSISECSSNFVVEILYQRRTIAFFRCNLNKNKALKKSPLLLLFASPNFVECYIVANSTPFTVMSPGPSIEYTYLNCLYN
jgi:hypothetical protein